MSNEFDASFHHRPSVRLEDLEDMNDDSNQYSSSTNTPHSNRYQTNRRPYRQNNSNPNNLHEHPRSNRYNFPEDESDDPVEFSENESESEQDEDSSNEDFLMNPRAASSSGYHRSHDSQEQRYEDQQQPREKEHHHEKHNAEYFDLESEQSYLSDANFDHRDEKHKRDYHESKIHSSSKRPKTEFKSSRRSSSTDQKRLNQRHSHSRNDPKSRSLTSLSSSSSSHRHESSHSPKKSVSAAYHHHRRSHTPPPQSPPPPSQEFRYTREPRGEKYSHEQTYSHEHKDRTLYGAQNQEPREIREHRNLASAIVSDSYFNPAASLVIKKTDTMNSSSSSSSSSGGGVGGGVGGGGTNKELLVLESNSQSTNDSKRTTPQIQQQRQQSCIGCGHRLICLRCDESYINQSSSSSSTGKEKDNDMLMEPWSSNGQDFYGEKKTRSQTVEEIPTTTTAKKPVSASASSLDTNKINVYGKTQRGSLKKIASIAMSSKLKGSSTKSTLHNHLFHHIRSLKTNIKYFPTSFLVKFQNYVWWFMINAQKQTLQVDASSPYKVPPQAKVNHLNAAVRDNNLKLTILHKFWTPRAAAPPSSSSLKKKVK